MKSNFERIAAATSSRMVHLFDLNSSKGFTQIQRYDGSPFNAKDDSSISGIRFSKEHPNSLFVAEASGNIYLYDIRSKPTHVQTFHADKIDKVKPYTCFDMNADETLLCVGTEQTHEECHIILFDVRKWSTFATYTDSHSQDLTQVKFHPNKPNVLASGSTDGLINVFNVSETDEDDALEYCINTESSVQTINWHAKNDDMEVGSNASGDLLTCITNTNDFQLIDVDESEIIFQTKRDQIVKHMMRQNVDECYLANCHSALNGDIFLLSGSHGNAGECLRSLTVRQKSFEPRNNFNENKQIVRCSVFNSKVYKISSDQNQISEYL